MEDKDLYRVVIQYSMHF